MGKTAERGEEAAEIDVDCLLNKLSAPTGNSDQYDDVPVEELSQEESLWEVAMATCKACGADIPGVGRFYSTGEMARVDAQDRAFKKHRGSCTGGITEPEQIKVELARIQTIAQQSPRRAKPNLRRR